jgi:DNA-binding response OmpR family regulator
MLQATHWFDGNPNILLIVADPALRTILQLLLERNGFATTVARNGEGGAEEARRARTDVIILDVSADSEASWDAWQEARQVYDAPLILLSSGLGRADTIRGLLSGADACLTKPFTFDELQTSIDALLRQNIDAPALGHPVPDQAWPRVEWSNRA